MPRHSTRRERHSEDQGCPRSANHQSLPRSSPGVEFADGEAPRRYNLGLRKQHAFPTRASKGNNTDSADRNKAASGRDGRVPGISSAWDAAMPPGMVRMPIKAAVLIDDTRARQSYRVCALSGEAVISATGDGTRPR